MNNCKCGELSGIFASLGLWVLYMHIHNGSYIMIFDVFIVKVIYHIQDDIGVSGVVGSAVFNITLVSTFYLFLSYLFYQYITLVLREIGTLPKKMDFLIQNILLPKDNWIFVIQTILTFDNLSIFPTKYLVNCQNIRSPKRKIKY